MGLNPWRLSVLGGALVVGIGASDVAVAGDGSGADNPDLLRGGLAAGCVDATLCAADKTSEQTLAASPITLEPTPPLAPMAATASCEDLAAMGYDGADCGLPLRDTDPLKSMVGDHATDDALFGDWSVGLRGTVVASTSGARFEAVVAPEGSLRFAAPGATASLNGSAEIVQGLNAQARLGAANGSATGTYAITRDLDFVGSADVGVSQDSPEWPGASPTINSQPVILGGGGEAGINHRFGKFAAGAGVDVRREVYSNTGYTNGAWVDNSYRNRTGLGGTLSASFSATPVLTAFGEVSADRSVFDAASPSLGVKQDAWTYQGRGGMRGTWGERGQAEIWAGYFQRRFDAGTLAPVEGLTYGGKLDYLTAVGLRLSATLETSVAEAGDVAGATARIGHSGALEASYPVNDWMRLRLSGTGYRNELAGTALRETGYTLGAGVDWTVAPQISVSADYSYGYDELTTSTERSQRVTLGATVSR